MTVDEYELAVTNTLNGVDLRFLVYKKEQVRHPSSLGGTTIRLDKPVNNKNFSLSGKGEEGTLNFTAKTIFDPDASNADRSAGTLQDLIDTLEAGTTDDQEHADRLKNRFGQDSSGNYIVRTVREQGIWLREYIHNPGLEASWTLFGPEYDYRTTDSNGNNTGTPVFVQEADIEENPQNQARGVGIIRFKVGSRL